MDRQQAQNVLRQELRTYRRMTHGQLSTLVGDLRAYLVPSGTDHPFQVEIQVTWDARPGGDIRVLGAIDDGGWSAFRPLCEDVLVRGEKPA